MNWKHTLRQMKLEHIKQQTPNFFEASGGYDMKVKPYKDTTANELTRAIIDFITFKGGYANRISTTGTMRKINGQLKWTKGNSNKGAADIRILYKGISADIEIKTGKDKMSDAQKREKSKIEDAGGLYFVATSFEKFLMWFDTTLDVLNVLKNN